MTPVGRPAVVALCSGAVLFSAAAATAAPHTSSIVIEEMKFGPAPTDLHRGDTILWLNHDILRHSATAADHSFDVDLPAGAKAKTVLQKSGRIAFSCRYHPGMRGMLLVK